MDFRSFSWEDITIRDLKEGKTLILIYPSHELADFSHDVLQRVSYEINTSIHPKTKKYTLIITLRYNKEKDLELSKDTQRTSAEYLPLKWLNSGEVAFITTGCMKGDDLQIFERLPLQCPFALN